MTKNRQAVLDSPNIINNNKLGKKALSSKIGPGGGFTNEKFRLLRIWTLWFFTFSRALTPCWWNMSKNCQAILDSPNIILNWKLGQKALSSKIGPGGGFTNKKFRLLRIWTLWFFTFSRALTLCWWKMFKNCQAGYGSPYIIVNGKLGQKAILKKNRARGRV